MTDQKKLPEEWRCARIAPVDNRPICSVERSDDCQKNGALATSIKIAFLRLYELLHGVLVTVHQDEIAGVADAERWKDIFLVSGIKDELTPLPHPLTS